MARPQRHSSRLELMHSQLRAFVAKSEPIIMFHNEHFAVAGGEDDPTESVHDGVPLLSGAKACDQFRESLRRQARRGIGLELKQCVEQVLQRTCTFLGNQERSP